MRGLHFVSSSTESESKESKTLPCWFSRLIGIFFLKWLNLVCDVSSIANNDKNDLSRINEEVIGGNCCEKRNHSGIIIERINNKQ